MSTVVAQVRRPQAQRNAWIALCEMHSIDTPSHRRRIERLVEVRGRREHHPKNPKDRAGFVIVTLCLERISKAKASRMSGYELRDMLETELGITLLDKQLNAILVKVARHLRRELKIANRQDAGGRVPHYLRRKPTAPTTPKESMC